MAIKIIDGAFTGSAFPTTYTGPGTLVGNILQDGGVGQMTSGNFTSTNDQVDIYLGYQPRRIRILNETDVVVWEKMVGMAAANAIKTVTGGTTTVDTNGYITFTDGGSGNWRISLSATLVGNSKAIVFIVEG